MPEKKKVMVFYQSERNAFFSKETNAYFIKRNVPQTFFWNQKFYLLCKERLRNVNDCRCDVFPNSDLHRGVPSSGAFPNMSNFLKYFILSCNVNSPLYILQN